MVRERTICCFYSNAYLLTLPKYGHIRSLEQIICNNYFETNDDESILNIIIFVGLEVLTGLVMRSFIFWDIRPGHEENKKVDFQWTTWRYRTLNNNFY
jgi:hypothetical protein